MLDLQLNPSVAEGYKSASQVARRVTEDWAAHNLFCTVCTSDKLTPARNNAAVLDYHCATCSAAYQLKSQSSPFGRTVSNSAYGKKMEAIRAGKAPHYAFLRYSATDWVVTGLFLVPGHFFTPDLIQRRTRLSPKARRAGWQGSNIRLGLLPDEARVAVVTNGIVRDAADVRSDWARFQFLQTDQRARGGWGAAVLTCVRGMVRGTGDSRFTLQEFYAAYTDSLAAQFPDNQHVRDKIRQQLQVLRDAGILAFHGRGVYEVIA